MYLCMHVYRNACVCLYIFTGCDRYISHILNCHTCGASEIRQVLTLDPSSECLTHFLYNQGLEWCSTYLLLKPFLRPMNMWLLWRAFHIHFMLCWKDAVLDRNSILL